MNIKRRRAGFTLAEMLIVVAIVVILLAVAFIGVQRYMRTMTQLEYDAAAKEIFVAAQNHLSMAHSQGYLGVTDTSKYGTEDTAAGKVDGDYYFVTKNGEGFGSDTLLDMMLPYGSADAYLLSGNILIRYNSKAGVVTDVFYSTKNEVSGFNLGSRYGYDGNFADAEVYAALLGCRDIDGDGTSVDNKSARRNFNGSGKIVGWYGGAKAEGMMKLVLDDPSKTENVVSLEIENGDKLIAWVTLRDDVWEIVKNDTNDPSNSNGIMLKLRVKGKTSKKESIVELIKYPAAAYYGSVSAGEAFPVILDDVTESGKHFAELFGGFMPGENLEIEAEVSAHKVLMPVYSSGKRTTNSLFGDGTQFSPADSNRIENARISSIRHLENMSPEISNIGKNSATIYLGEAEQTKDLDWIQFCENINNLNNTSGEKVKVYKYGEAADTSLSENLYLPVNPEIAVAYDGKSHYIKNVNVNAATPAGLFGNLISGAAVKDLELVNFNIKSTGDAAGALAGTSAATIKNVFAHNERNDDESFEVSGTAAAGGLIGTTTGGSVTQCAAALYVKSSGGAAGGLIGSMSGGSVSGSYSGGHTEDGKYLVVDTDGAAHRVNVISGSGAAGGLIGALSSGTVDKCYSTCSVKGSTAGGFAGVASGTVTDSYCTGLVLGTTRGAFSGGGSSGSGNLYYEIVNHDLTPVAGAEKADVLSYVTAFDETLETFEQKNDADTVGFCPVNPNMAFPYDGKLSGYYRDDTRQQSQYPFRTISQMTELTGVLKTHLTSHFGDWPSYETMVKNDKDTP